MMTVCPEVEWASQKEKKQTLELFYHSRGGNEEEKIIIIINMNMNWTHEHQVMASQRSLMISFCSITAWKGEMIHLNSLTNTCTLQGDLLFLLWDSVAAVE